MKAEPVRLLKSILWASAFATVLPLSLVRDASASCSASTDTWTGSTNSNWNNNSNWSPTTGYPGSGNTNNATIQAASRVPNFNTSVSIGCFYVSSGTMTVKNGTTMTVAGDYFRNLTLGSISVGANAWTVAMSGTGPQTFENADTMYAVTNSNAVSLEFTQSFTITNALTLNAGSGIVYVDNTLTLSNTAVALTIPSSATVEVKNGGTLIAAGGITVNGVLKIDAGGQVLIGNGKTLQVNSGGVLQLVGASGNVAALDAYGGGSNSYALTIASGGAFNADYFTIARTTAAGLNVSGTIQSLSHGDFHYIKAAGYAVTLAAGSSAPLTWDSVGFFDDFASGTAKNVIDTAYTGSTISVTNWSGIGGATYETGTHLNWGSQAAPLLQITNATAAGNPSATIGKGSAATLFSTFGFSLNSASTATNITSVTLTLTGTASASDINYIQVFDDANGNCTYDAGVDTQIGGNLTVAGSPPMATVTIPAGTISPSNSTAKCMHVLVATSSTATTNATVQVSVSGTSDVVNDQNYSFSSTSGPPVSGGSSSISGTAPYVWTGKISNVWTNGRNWNLNNSQAASPPATTNDCNVGSTATYPVLSAGQTVTCQNVNLSTGGTMDWGSTNVNFSIYGGLMVQSGFSFLNAGSGTLNIAGSTNQSLQIWTPFPGNMNVASTGGTVSVDASSTIYGNVTLTSGTLSISSGITLLVGGNLTINGGTLIINPGATLEFGGTGASTLTLTSGTLQIIGSSSQVANITSSNSNGYSIVANGGTLKAQYYAIDHLNASGVAINSGTTIDSTYHLQNGSFSYPTVSGGSLLTLNTRIPGDALANMTFDAGASTVTPVTGLTTNTNAGGASLTITTYAGSLSGSSNTVVTGSPGYPVSWSGATNTLNLTSVLALPASLAQGSTVTGEFGFAQTQAGTFSNTNITTLKLTMIGSGTSSDVSAARIYYDSGCTGATTTLLGSGTFSGNPATVTFSSLSGASVPSNATSPPIVCILVQLDISNTASSGNNLGVEIASNGDVVNSQSYAFNGTAAPPVTLGTGTVTGTSTTWTGSTSTDWFTASNWNNGVPSSSLNCNINSATRSPVIGAGGPAACKTLTIGNGNLTMTAGSGAELDIYGSFSNTGTFVQNGQTLKFIESGSASNQTLASSSALDAMTFTKTVGGGKVSLAGNVSIGSASATPNNTLTLPSGSNFTFDAGAYTLTLPNGATVTAGTLQVGSGGKILVGTNKDLRVSGGTFKVNGGSYAYPSQAYSNAGTLAPQTAGNRWTFTATSGLVSMNGAIIDSIGANGLNLSSGVVLSAFNYVQFLNLATANLPALNLNNALSTLTANYIGFNFGASVNSTYSTASPAPPAITSSYSLVTSGATSSGSLTFMNWFGDFYNGLMTTMTAAPTSGYKYTQSGATISFTAANSPVLLTQLSATPYQSTVVVSWTTGSEWDHQGFNVYRSTSPQGGFVQINPGLIRNNVVSTSPHADYQYYDNGVVNGTTYYYMIEDFAVNGTRTMHGPVSAAPDAALTAAPAPSGGTIASSGSTSSPAPSGSSSFAPAQTELAPGVTLISKTLHSMRIKLTIPAFTTSADSVNPYVHLAIPGYSHATDAGLPELLSRVVMLETPDAATAALTIVSQTQSATNGVSIAPAPLYVQSSGSMVPSWTIDSSFYGTNQTLPTTALSAGAVTQSQGRTYLPLIVSPVSYNPVTQVATQETEIVADITLDGASSWNIGGQPGSSGPWALEGALRITIDHTGLYQLSYSDLVGAGVDGPFAGADVSKLRLMQGGSEVPLDVTSSTGAFGGTDTVRFFASYSESEESRTNTLLLFVDSIAGSRMATVDGDPGALSPAFGLSSVSFKRVEQANFGYFNEPYAEGMDHVFWTTFGAPATNPGDDLFVTNVDLPNLVPDGNVEIRVLVKATHLYTGHQTPHHLRLKVNNVAASLGDDIFTDEGPHFSSFTVPASYFGPGTNRLTFQAILEPGAGTFERFYLDYINVNYPHDWVADADVFDARTVQTGAYLTIQGFNGADIAIFDVTDPNAVAKVTHGIVGADSLGTQQIRFGASGNRYWVTRSSLFEKPLSIELNPGSNLLSSVNSADAIFIGTAQMLDAAATLMDYRRGQGYRVVAVDIEQVFAEFGQGSRNAQAVKDFLQYASQSWTAPAPKYVVLVGDGTYDPKNDLQLGTRNTLPIHLMPGMDLDFASDNWFVAWNPSDALPGMAIGRIPGNTPELIETYVTKVMAYESGAARPSVSSTYHVVLASDTDQIGGENFSGRADSLLSQIQAGNSNVRVSRIQRPAFVDPATDALNDAQMKSQIVSAFNSGTVLLNYLGHGAEDEWAGSGVFTNADADALTNPKLPIVVSMDCLNAYFYDADPTFQSLADRLLFNSRGGAIAMWGSTSMTSPEIQGLYQSALYQVLVTNPGMRLGEAIRQAKINVGWSSTYAEFVESFTLLGDPMIQVQLPAPPSSSARTGSGSSSSQTGSSAEDGSSSHHGFMACGSISTGSRGGGGSGGPGAPEIAELALLVMMVLGARRLARVPANR